MNSPAPPITKAESVTASERYLRQLCESSFLSLWTYPSIFRDQGKTSPDADGKEVCDLVVVFRNHVILFSDKSCEFPNSGNLDVDWSRWFRKAVKKSADQLWGAERWFRDFQELLYLDRRCTEPFPITLPSPSDIQFHRIAVARGAGAACKEHYGGSASLLLYSGWAERATKVAGNKLPLFAVGDLDPNRGFVHVFDDFTLETVLRTLDTPADFVNYLVKKERFVRSRAFALAAGEEHLLAVYFQCWTQDGELDFPTPLSGPAGKFGNPRPYIIAEGGWEELIQSDVWRALQAWREPSYYWVFLIKRVSDHAINGTLYRVPDPSPKTQEMILRILAAEPRYRRRMLSATLLRQIGRAPTDAVLDRCAGVVPSSHPDEPTYVFVVVGTEEGESHDSYRMRRRSLLERYARVAKHVYPEGVHIIVLGIEARDVARRTVDIVYQNTTEWTQEMAVDAERVHREESILVDMTEVPLPHEPRHYLDAKIMRDVGEQILAQKPGRNAACPCGSGKKYKTCHGLEA